MEALLLEHCDLCGAAAAVEPIVETAQDEERCTVGYRVLVCPDTRRIEPEWVEWEGSPATSLADACAAMAEAQLSHYLARHEGPEDAADEAELPEWVVGPTVQETVIEPIVRQQQSSMIGAGSP